MKISAGQNLSYERTVVNLALQYIVVHFTVQCPVKAGKCCALVFALCMPLALVTLSGRRVIKFKLTLISIVVNCDALSVFCPSHHSQIDTVPVPLSNP